MFVNVSVCLFCFSDGQALASRLSKQITRVTKDVNKDIAAYNEAKQSHSNHTHTALTLDAVKDPDNDFWCEYLAAPTDEDCSVPFTVKRKAIDLCHLLDRSKEEQILLKSEMENTWSHYFQQHGKITDFLNSFINHENVLDVEYGEAIFLHRKIFQIESMLIDLKKGFLCTSTKTNHSIYFMGMLTCFKVIWCRLWMTKKKWLYMKKWILKTIKQVKTTMKAPAMMYNGVVQAL